ncbi:MAG: SDR family oxidoreductase [Actinomycetota bacterium]
MSRFTDRIAFLTGAASGVGRATAIRLASEGASVFGVDVNEAGLSETVELAGDLEGSITTRRLDVTDVADIAAGVAECVEALGGIDIVGNIAGIARHHHVADVSEADWDLMNGINLKGPFFVAQATMPHLLERDGVLINIASNAGLIGQAYTVPYCATKGGVVNLTRALAMEFVKTAVRINAIAPGGIDTPLVHNFELADDIDFSLMQNHIGYRDPSSADQIAAFFAFLASDDASNIHGSILSADGGLTAA